MALLKFLKGKVRSAKEAGAHKGENSVLWICSTNALGSICLYTYINSTGIKLNKVFKTMNRQQQKIVS